MHVFTQVLLVTHQETLEVAYSWISVQVLFQVLVTLSTLTQCVLVNVVSPCIFVVRTETPIRVLKDALLHIFSKVASATTSPKHYVIRGKCVIFIFDLHDLGRFLGLLSGCSLKNAMVLLLIVIVQESIHVIGV